MSSQFPFQTAADFGESDVDLHINVKEAIAFWKLMCNFLPFHRNEVQHKKLLVHTQIIWCCTIFIRRKVLRSIKILHPSSKKNLIAVGI